MSLIASWGKDENKTFAELVVHGGCSGIEAAGIIEQARGDTDMTTEEVTSAAKYMGDRREVCDLMLRMQAGELGIRKKTEKLLIRYVIPKCRSEMAKYLNKSFDPNARGAAFQRQMKMFEKCVASDPDEPENQQVGALERFARSMLRNRDAEKRQAEVAPDRDAGSSVH